MAPKSLLLMRHAEKPEEPSDPHLSPEGEDRAKRLATWVPRQLGGPPDFIFAAANSEESDRPVETVTPLSQGVDVPINADTPDKQYAALATELLSDASYEGKLVVVAWHHEYIPQFARSLGAADGSYPAHWPGDVFDLALRFDFSSHGARATQVTEEF